MVTIRILKIRNRDDLALGFKYKLVATVVVLRIGKRKKTQTQTFFFSNKIKATAFAKRLKKRLKK